MSVKVLIVDDSALIRQLLSELLSADPAIEVVGTAADPYVARDKIKQLRPDVLTLDVEMPRMDGLKFLENLMRLYPLPVVMVSSLTEAGAEVTLSALALGAVDFVAKPKLDVERGMREYADLLREKVKGAARARPAARTDTPARAMPVLSGGYRTTDRLIALGASAGGTEALRAVMERMPADAPAVVITQHIPAGFSRPFAERLNRSSAMTICEAEDGQPITPGCGYVAPGGRHLEVVRSGARWLCRLTDADPVNRHRPSVNVLFDSVLAAAGRNAVAGLLTGMGDDGARGLLGLRSAGVHTVVQDEATSVVWGMPGAAWKLGAADEMLPLDRIPERLLRWASE
ncbi:protein-glutamate methylesterase/protein-glutamine glutaminase [Coralloluteibacterium stylophorae]|uniref:Protein-glutamate methylesterase/protein-glutamine glutaminase n=1 Tax=Coralloluteibacterium stylophorae TaxID=1776034 RepID=A0A8J7VUL4_9GAMM|nr:chemotaxis response regulator protein-glutamate methylesterase [Coralloluteibacterium stylophorae]MBS7457266.1 chemotaxis response regulator protein-glutamate methylesterase [Coralloluteibacterium stylophorae]